MTAVALLLLVIVLATYLYLFSKTRPKNFPPGPPRLPLWGNYWFLLKEHVLSHLSTARLAKRYKTDILGLDLQKPTVVVLSYDAAKEVLQRKEFAGREDNIVSRTRSENELQGLFFLDGAYWTQQRRFALRHLRDFGFGRRFDSTEHIFESDVKDLIHTLNSEPTSENKGIYRMKGQMLVPNVFFSPLANYIMYILIGKRFEGNFLRMLVDTSIMVFLRSIDATGNALSITPWLKYIAPQYFGFSNIVKESKRVFEFFSEHIQDHKQKFQDDHQYDFVDKYIDQMRKLEKEGRLNNSGFTDKQLAWVLIDVMFPVPATLAYTIQSLWLYLLMYPNVQVKIQNEIDDVVGRTRLPNLEDRKTLHYTEAVIREVLRMEPSLPLNLARRCLVDTTLNGYSIPKDTIILINLWTANRDEKVWIDPNVFMPERFLDDEGKLLKIDKTLTFGGGKHLCIGETLSKQMMFLLLSCLLQNFTFEAVGDVPDLNNKVFGIINNKPDFWVNAVPRS